MIKEYEITGLDNVEQMLQQLPLQYAKKPVVAAFRKGAAVFSKQLKQNSPKATGSMLKSIKVKAQKGAAITVGFQGGGESMPGYFKAYWNNYGTLDNRDQSHKFVKNRKPITKNWSGGVRSKRFVEASWEQTKTQVEQVISKELVTQTEKFLNKHAVKD